ncbi:hypothetical protein C8R42DRAFT_415652 [Lentinula raphanica]|nr:hypothetical protein C8R42DRAFT_415652 [Lentinula raphanica]
MRSSISKEDESNSRGREIVHRRVYLNTPSYQLGTEASNPDRGGFEYGFDTQRRLSKHSVRSKTITQERESLISKPSIKPSISSISISIPPRCTRTRLFPVPPPLSELYFTIATSSITSTPSLPRLLLSDTPAQPDKEMTKFLGIRCQDEGSLPTQANASRERVLLITNTHTTLEPTESEHSLPCPCPCLWPSPCCLYAGMDKRTRVAIRVRTRTKCARLGFSSRGGFESRSMKRAGSLLPSSLRVNLSSRSL